MPGNAVMVAPKGQPADPHILFVARDLGARIVSNDRFRDWAGEATGFPREVIEAARAHGIKDKAEAAYARSDLFDKRRDLIEAWTAATALAEYGLNVVRLSEA